MSKLLHKPFKIFTVYALFILLCSIPAYYLVVDAIWLEELDEHNSIIRARMENGIKKIDLEGSELTKTLNAWNSVQPGTKLVRAAAVKPDSIYTITTWNHYEKETDRFRVLSTYIDIQGKPYHLTIATNVEEADETLMAIAFVTALFFMLLIGGFVILNRRISRKIWSPFRDTLDKLKSFDLNAGKSVIFVSSGITEFEELNRELTVLIEKNITAFSQQKGFIENASHELQTPLAVLRTKIDLLLQSEDLTEEQSEIIEAIANNLARVSRINKNMLLLAKIENNQFSETAQTDISEVLSDSIELLSDYLTDKEMRLQLHCDTYRVNANPVLLEVLFNNLLINAIFHGQKGDTIRIVLQDGVIAFSNAGVKALDRNELFKRFSVSSSETMRSGLGLAIAKEICNRYEWAFFYDFVDGKHIFTIRFQ